MSRGDFPRSERDTASCRACKRDIPRDALLCPYCCTSVLAALLPDRTNEPATDSSPASTCPARDRSWSRWVPVAAAWAFLLLSLMCCLMAVVVVSYATDRVGGWPDLVSLLAGRSSQEQTEPAPTPVGSEVPPRPKPTETPAAPTAPSPLQTPEEGLSSMALPENLQVIVDLLSRES
jgi:hypothetical protein